MKVSKHPINGMKRRMSLSIWLLLTILVVFVTAHAVSGFNQETSFLEYGFWLVALTIFSRYWYSNFQQYRFVKTINGIDLLEEHLALSINTTIEQYDYDCVALVGYEVQLKRANSELIKLDSRLFENTIELMNHLNANIAEAAVA